MLLTVLGSGTAMPTHRRASAGYLLEWRGGACLLDASAGTYMRALKAGLNPARLKAVVFTHMHPDHTADLGGILWARRMTPDLPDEPLTLIGPPGTALLLDRFHAVYAELITEVPCVVAPFPADVAGLRVDAFPAAHSNEAVCLRITDGERVLGYSGDTADCDGVRAACRGADLALIECTSAEPLEGHMTPADCEAVVAAALPRETLLTHIGPNVRSSLPMAEDGLAISI